jgi:hypothetical protein
MIATAMKIQGATQFAVTDIETMTMARDIAFELADGDRNKLERIAELMFQYSAHLASATATAVTFAIMGDKDFNTMVDEIRELDNLTQLIEGENN